MAYWAGAVMTILVGISAAGSLSCHIMTSSRLCFVGARHGHIPNCLSLVTVDTYTPKPALIFLVSFVFCERSELHYCTSERSERVILQIFYITSRQKITYIF